MFEWVTASVVYSATKDIAGAILRRLKSISPQDVLAAREKWRPLFEKEIWTNFKEDLRRDVIIVNIAKLDEYPKSKERKKGISPWFRGALLDTCDEGAMIWLRTGTLMELNDGPGWRFTNHDIGETGDIDALLIGIIPFELIENVNWHGTDYYNFPHIYCRFQEKRGQPYRRMGFYQERPRPEMPPYYLEIEPYDPVRKISRKFGIKYFA